MTHAEIMAYLEARTVEEGRCLLWRLALSTSGAPVATMNGQSSIPVRRWVWENWNGQKAGALRVVAACNNRRCVSPHCVEAITPSEFNLRMSALGLMSSPTVCIARAKAARRRSPLTLDDIRAIRARYAAGETSCSIAEDYPVGETAVARICSGRTWVDHAANPFAQLARAVA